MTKTYKLAAIVFLGKAKLSTTGINTLLPSAEGDLKELPCVFSVRILVYVCAKVESVSVCCLWLEVIQNL